MQLPDVSSGHRKDVEPNQLQNVVDPYRDATISAKGTSFPSTPNRPIVAHDSFQTADLRIALAESDPTIADLQRQALTTIKRWIREWNDHRHSGH